jgi:acyl-CoA thioesterase FadM
MTSDPDLFIKTFFVRWGDLDSKGHMKNTPSSIR